MKRSSVSTSLSKVPESYPVASHEVPFPPSDNAGASSPNYEQSATQRIVPISATTSHPASTLLRPPASSQAEMNQSELLGYSTSQANLGQICGSVASGAPAYRDLQQSGDFSNPAMANFNIPNSKSISTDGNIQQHISTAPAQRQGIHSNMLQHKNSEQPVSITTVVPSHATSGHHINPGTFPTRFS